MVISITGIFGNILTSRGGFAILKREFIGGPASGTKSIGKQSLWHGLDCEKESSVRTAKAIAKLKAPESYGRANILIALQSKLVLKTVLKFLRVLKTKPVKQ